MAKSTPFRCPICGAGGYQPCVVGKIGSKKWLEQIPLHRWHFPRTEMLKKLNSKSATPTGDQELHAGTSTQGRPESGAAT